MNRFEDRLIRDIDHKRINTSDEKEASENRHYIRMFFSPTWEKSGLSKEEYERIQAFKRQIRLHTIPNTSDYNEACSDVQFNHITEYILIDIFLQRPDIFPECYKASPHEDFRQHIDMIALFGDISSPKYVAIDFTTSSDKPSMRYDGTKVVPDNFKVMKGRKYFMTKVTITLPKLRWREITKRYIETIARGIRPNFDNIIASLIKEGVLTDEQPISIHPSVFNSQEILRRDIFSHIPRY